MVRRGAKGKRSAGKQRAESPHAVYYPSQGELAWLFSKSLSEINRWAKDGAPPKTKRGYNPKKWFGWWKRKQARLAGNNGSGSSGGTPDVVEELKAVKLRRELRAEERENGEYILVVVAEQKMAETLRWQRAVFDRAPMELRTLLAGKSPAEHGEIFKRYCDDKCREIVAKAQKG